MIFIIIIVGLAALYYYIQGLLELETIMQLMIALAVVSGISSVVFLAMAGTGPWLSGKQKSAIEEAAKKDQENVKINESRRNAAVKKIQRANETRADDIRKNEISPLKQELEIHRRNLVSMDILSPEDMDLETVDFLIGQLERRRASSVEMALNQYDAKKSQEEERKKREQREWERYQNERLQRQLDQRLADQRYAAEVDRQIDLDWEMKRLAKKQLEETEKLRREQEYYQRYGKSINEL